MIIQETKKLIFKTSKNNNIKKSKNNYIFQKTYKKYKIKTLKWIKYNYKN